MFIGYLDLRGEVLPVVGAREWLARPSRPLALTDRFVVVQAASRRAAIVVDHIEGVEEITMISDSGNDRQHGLTIGRRPGAADGEGLVASIDLDRLLAGSSISPNGAMAS
jgi:chemotaxis signal transduction protein